MWKIIIAVISAVLASSGFWAFILKRSDRKSAKMKLLLGIAGDRIIHLGMKYISRGSVTKDEYEMLHEYLWLPYRECGGNGTAAKIMDAVDRLPIK